MMSAWNLADRHFGDDSIYDFRQRESSSEHRKAGAQTRTNVCELLGWLNGGLPFRVVADQDEMSMIRRHRLSRVRRPKDRECLRTERQREQNAEGKHLHYAVLLCIICAIEIVIRRLENQWVNHHWRTR